ncbi:MULTISPECIES: hypothetical protein [Trichocoleus]|uniref:Uncharacterized protein n=1 Tax=Trichocoleus desertorum GB2-A4 TaxID=2933944 RepID=A0ABV0JBS1_9CYAN|nr:hypothetical protein [Trichocoleus sp. FACHB-46]MBD1865369.1 hypothetical protein [Trichocoleus sp. FACHB-46]
MDTSPNFSPALSEAIALVDQLSINDQKKLALYLLLYLYQRSVVSRAEIDALVLVDSEPPDPLGPTSTVAVGWKQEKRVVKERDSGAINTYIEYWFNCEVWSSKEEAWKHKSCYICQHPEGRSPSPGAARKIELLNRQIANKRPYWETMQLLNKQRKLEQWQGHL